MTQLSLGAFRCVGGHFCRSARLTVLESPFSFLPPRRLSTEQAHMSQPTFLPLDYINGYLPIEDHGLIGDGATAALVARDGAVTWMCLPRFDSPPLFCSILDSSRGGCFRISPRGLVAARQYYEPDTGVLHTEMQTPSGVLRLTDALTFHAGAVLTEDVRSARQELLRRITVLQGEVTLDVSLTPRTPARTEAVSGGLVITCPDRPDLALHLTASIPLNGLRTEISLRDGETVSMQLRWNSGQGRHRPIDSDTVLANTTSAWRRWMEQFHYDGPQEALVRGPRSP